ETDEHDEVGDAAGFKVLEPFLEPGLARPPAGDAPGREPLAHEVPAHRQQESPEQQLDQPRRRQFAPREERPDEQDRAYETGNDPQDAEVQVLGTDDIEVERPGE